MYTLYVNNERPCKACDMAKEAIIEWEQTGSLKENVDIKPLPSNPEFQMFVRIKTGGRWGWPILHDDLTQNVILGFPEERYRQLLCV